MQIKKCIKLAVKLKDEKSLDEICNDCKISKHQIFDSNNTTRFNKNDIILVPSKTKREYVVKPLDTIESIAKKMGVDTNNVYCATNGKIFIGQKIFV